MIADLKMDGWMNRQTDSNLVTEMEHVWFFRFKILKDLLNAIAF